MKKVVAGLIAVAVAVIAGCSADDGTAEESATTSEEVQASISADGPVEVSCYGEWQEGREGETPRLADGGDAKCMEREIVPTARAACEYRQTESVKVVVYLNGDSVDNAELVNTVGDFDCATESWTEPGE